MASLDELRRWAAALGGREQESVTDHAAGGEIGRVSKIGQADEGSCVFATEAAALAEAVASRAGAILASASLRNGAETSPQTENARVLWVPDARYAFATFAERLRPHLAVGRVDATAIVAEDAVLGARTVIGAGAVIGAGVSVGNDCAIGPRVSLLAGVVLGDRVVVQAGAVLGSDGFGYVRHPKTGAYLRFPQQGTLVVEEDVEIGANTTIDRGALGETRIGRGTKIDNLVHIGHNCRIGRDVVIAAQTGIAGSSVVEDGAVLGGQVGIADHVTIGGGVILGAQAGVPSGKRLRGAGQVFWGTPARPIKEYLRDLARLRQQR